MLIFIKYYVGIDHANKYAIYRIFSLVYAQLNSRVRSQLHYVNKLYA